MSNFTKSLLTLFSALLLIGCAGTKTFHELARPGDTIAVAAGWMHHLQRDNITVTITDSASNATTYTATPGNPDPNVRASINFYPDPVSSLVVSNRIGENLTPSAGTYAQLIDANSTLDPATGESDNDWWETVVFVDLPDPMMPGAATVDITANDASGESISSGYMIVGEDDGTGSGMVTGGQPNTFSGKLGEFVTFDLNEDQLKSMERLNHHVVTFSGTTLPHAIQIDMTHDGTGTPYVVNPVGSIKSISWADDAGTTPNLLRVILMPSEDAAIDAFVDFKFYVTGSVNGLALAASDPVKGFTSAGARLDPPDDVSAQIK